MKLEINNEAPLLISFNQQQYDNDISGIDNVVTKCQEAVNAFNALGFESVSEDELPMLFTDPAALLESKMIKQVTEEDLTLKNGLKISRESMMQNLEKPLGFILVADTIEKTRQIIIDRAMKGAIFTANSLKEFWHYFTFTGGTLAVKDKVKQRLKEKYQVFVNGNKAKALFSLAEFLTNLLSESKIYETYFSKEHERYRGEKLLGSLIKIVDAKPTINIDHLVHVDQNG